MTIADLPVELLRACFRYLDSLDPSQEALRDRARALSACCLVSKMWASIAQPTLFERVQLDLALSVDGNEQELVCAPKEGDSVDRDRTSALPAFLEICSERPDLAGHTTWLRIVKANRHPRERKLTPCIPTLLRSLPSLRDLLVCGAIELDLAWLGIPPGAYIPSCALIWPS